MCIVIDVNTFEKVIDVTPLLKLAKLDATKLSEMIGFVNTAIPDDKPEAS